jgi:hypothetical protein
VVTLKLPAVPVTKVVLLALSMVGGWSTVSVKPCVALGLTPFCAVIIMLYVPPVPPPGVPLRTPALVNVTPVGRAPVSLNVGAGNPVAVTAKEPAVPTVKVVLFALVTVVVCGATTVSFRVFDVLPKNPVEP